MALNPINQVKLVNLNFMIFSHQPDSQLPQSYFKAAFLASPSAIPKHFPQYCTSCSQLQHRRPLASLSVVESQA